MTVPVVPSCWEHIVRKAEIAFLAPAQRGLSDGVGLVRHGRLACSLYWSATLPGHQLELAICTERIESTATRPRKITAWITRQLAVTKRYAGHQRGADWLGIGFANTHEALSFLGHYHDVRIGLLNPDDLYREGAAILMSPPRMVALPAAEPAEASNSLVAIPPSSIAEIETEASLLHQFRQATAHIPAKSEADQLARQQVGLDLIRKALLRLHVTRCDLTGLGDSALLCVTHLKPWSACTDAERMDLSNVLLLATHVDMAFCRGLVSFDDDGCLLMSSEYGDYCRYRGISVLTGALRLRQPDADMCKYLAWHRANVYHRAPSWWLSGLATRPRT
ncbi:MULTISPECIES: HNH endonuclease signature motif containing protein [unclassified Cupriavidus]|jgi:hypothetical protein|uniref:HNH endonuclease signature motif containing protein n=1 Tax=unclassified Cupriavidus TaxID=2640874 RepID=UPI0010FA5561|nr:HNH endonuclease [Cupriavidus sp. EM10]